MIYSFGSNLKIDKFTPYIHFPGFFSKDECQKIKSIMNKVETVRAQVEADGSGAEVENVRSTTICGIEAEKSYAWIFQKLADAIVQANYDIWGYELLGFSEVIQISRYDVGDHYDWHMDIGGGVLSQRKLSVVAQLTDSSEYEGGDLEFFKHGLAPRDQGTLILFPSFMHHRVLEIKKGVRHSLVAWLSGNPYK